MASPRSISGPSAFDDGTEARFDRPLTLSWEEQRKRISLRDTPKKIPIPASPMNMKARMSAFGATSISSAISSPPFVKWKKAFPAPPLADFLSSEDVLAETTVLPVLEADEISVCDASTTSHTVPIEDEDDSDGEDKSLEASVVLDSSNETLMMEESPGASVIKSCEAERDDVATASHDSQMSDSFRRLDVCQEDVCQEDGSLETLYDRPLTLSWEDQRKMISKRDFPKKIPIPASPMGMKARMGAFEVKQAISTPTTPLVWKTWKTPIASPSPVGPDLRTEKVIPAPPLVDDFSSEDTLTETAFSPASAVDKTSVCDAKMTSHVVPTLNENDYCSENKSSNTSAISHSSNGAPRVEETCSVDAVGKTVQAISSEAENDDIAAASRDSEMSDSFRHLDVCQEDGSLETPYDRPLTLSWEDQRKMISRRDFPKKVPIPASPMGMKARMGAFEMKQPLSTCTPPLAKKGSIASSSPVKEAFKPKKAIPAPPLVDDFSSGDTLTETTVPSASAVDETSVCDAGDTKSDVDNGIDNTSHVSQYADLEEHSSVSQEVISDGAPVAFVNAEGTTEYSFTEERKEIQPRVNCQPSMHEQILAPYEEQQKALGKYESDKSKSNGGLGGDSDSYDAIGSEAKSESEAGNSKSKVDLDESDFHSESKIEEERKRSREELRQKRKVAKEIFVGSKEDVRRRQLAFSWYSTHSTPSRSELREKLAVLYAFSISPDDVSPDDVDLLPWNATGSLVDIAKMNALFRASEAI